MTGSVDIGGLAGRVLGDISNSHAIGRVVVNSHSVVSSGHGGLVGQLRGVGTSINSSYALGSVDAQACGPRCGHHGGLVGILSINNKSINNSYAAASLAGSRIAKGGFAGEIRTSASVSDSYSISKVSGRSADRGFVRRVFNINSILRSYWDTQRSGQSLGGRGDVHGFDSRTLKSATPSTNTHPYLNWSTNHWDFGNTEQYPVLKYRDNTCDTSAPSANCGEVLPRQRLGLRDLQLSQIGVEIQPELSTTFSGAVLKDDFDSVAIENYEVLLNSRTSRVRIAAVAQNPDGVITINGSPMSVASANYSLVPDSSTITVVPILVSEPYQITGKENLDVEYRLTFSTFPEASAIAYRIAEDEHSEALSTSVPIREGHFITLNSELSDIDGDDLSYEWMVDETRVRLIDQTALSGTVAGGLGNAALSFYLREDYISANQSAESVNVSLMVRDDDGRVAVRELSFVVTKHNNGVIDGISTPTRVGFTYTAPTLGRVKLSEDLDGGGNTNNIAYQWQQQSDGIWSNIVGANAESYDIGGVIADSYRVIVSYRDGQGYLNTVASAPLPASTELVREVVPDLERDGFDVLILDADNLMPSFSLDVSRYRVPTETSRVRVTAIAGSGTIFINGTPLAENENTISVDLDYGDNEINVEWQGTNNISTQSYTVFRAYDIGLHSWRVAWQDENGEAQSRDFLGNPMQPQPPLRVSHGASITVTVGVNEHVELTITSNGNALSKITTSTQAGLLIAQATISDLRLGANLINFMLTSPQQSSATYTINVWQRYSSRLRDLSTEDGLRTPTGEPTVFDPLSFNYSTTLANHQDSITIEFQRNDQSTIVINSTPIADDATSIMIDGLDIGDNEITVEVSAVEEPDTIYRIVVVRDYNLNLHDLRLVDAQMTTVTLFPTFAPEQREYTAEVSDATTRVIVTFTTELQVISDLDANTTPTITKKMIIDENTPDARIEKIASVPVDFDKNPIVIRTWALGEQQATTLMVTRLRSTNARLQDLQVLNRDGVNMLSAFDPSTQNYIVEIDNLERTVSLRLTPQDTKISSILWNDIPLSLSGVETGSLSRGRPAAEPSFAVGGNKIELKIIAHDGITSQTYTLLVNRLPGINVRLQSILYTLSSSSGERPPQSLALSDFMPDTLEYTLAGVENAIDCILVNPRREDEEATIEIIKTAGIESDSPIECPDTVLSLGIGQNTIEIIVTASDETTTRTYTLNISRALSSDTNLSAAPTIIIAMDEASAIAVEGSDTEYTAVIDRNVSMFAVSATAAHSSATVTISIGDGMDAVGGRTATKADIPISFATIAMARREITITVTAQDGKTTEDYTVTAMIILGSDAGLASVNVSPGLDNLMPQGDPPVYTKTLAEDVINTTVTAVASDEFATVTIGENNTELASARRQAVADITLAETGDSRELLIRVTSENGEVVEDYTLRVSRAESSNDCLDAIAILDADGNLLSDADTNRDINCNDLSQSFDIANSLAQVLLRPTAENSHADINVRVPGDDEGEQVQSGADSTMPISVAEGGSAQARIKVMSQNDATSKTYVVTINRAASSDADLRDLRLLDINDANQLLPRFDPTSRTQVYRFNVSNATTGTRVVAEAHPQAVIGVTLDGGVEETSTGTINRRFDLTVPEIEKLIRIMVTSQDRSTTRGYTIAVTRDRAARNNADLASIVLLLDDDTPLLTLTQPDEGTSFTYSARITGTADREVQTIEQITVSPRAADLAATMSIDGGVAEAMPNASVMLVAALDTAEVPIPIKVIAEDGTTSATYSLLITRVSSADASLSSVVADGVTLMPSGDGTYTTGLDEHTTSTTVTVRTTHSQATVAITLNGDTSSARNELSRPVIIADSGDSRTLPIVVTAQDGKTTEDYTLSVSRAESSNDCLDAIAILDADGNLLSSADTNRDINCNDLSQSFDIANSVAQVLLRPTAENSHADINVRVPGDDEGEQVQSGADSTMPISVAEGGSAQARIKVMSQNDATSKTYVVTINRAASSDADLRDLRLLDINDANQLLPRFDPTSRTQVYRFNVSNATTGTRVVAEAHPQAVIGVTLDGGVEETSTGTINRRFDLTVPEIEKLIRIMVTSQDRSTTRGYTIAVTRDRAARNNADLASIMLLLDDDTPLLTLTQPDEGTSFTYSARITGTAGREVQTIEQITVSPRAADLAATMSIDGGVAEAMPNASVMLVAALDTAEVPIPIKVIAEDGTTSATYSLLITRVSSADASLASVVADGVTLMPSGDGTYTTRLDEHTTSTTVTVRTTHSQATVAITLDGDTSSARNELSRPVIIADSGDSRTLPIVVTAQDGKTTEDYTLSVSRAESSNDCLDAIAILDADGNLLSSADTNRDINCNDLSQSFDIANSVAQVLLRPTAENSHADINVRVPGDDEGEQVQSGADSTMPISVAEGGSAQARIEVMSQNGATSKTYVVTINRAASSDASLSSVVADGVTLMPGGDGTYATSLDEHTTSTTVTVKTTHSQATVAITLDGDTSSARNELSRPVVIADSGDSRTLQIVVTAQDDKTSQTYTVTIMRARSQDIRLSMLEVSAGQLTPAFVFDPLSAEHRQTGYSIELPKDIANTTITVMTANKHARLTIREANEPPSSLHRLIRQAIAVTEGAHTTATIVVTAQDGSTQTYTVVISRASAMDRIALGFMLNLSGIKLENESATTYIGQLLSATTNTIASASVAAAGVSIQSIRLNNDLQEYVEGGNPLHLGANMSATTVSQVIPLLRDENRITIVLRRTDNTEDGYTEANYIANARRTVLRVHIRVFLEGLLRTVPP